MAQNQKDKIINVASQIIMNKGIVNTSLNDIAKGVGISKGTLYYYYPSKDELIYDITIQHLEKISSELIMLSNTEYKQSNEKEILNLLFNRIINDDTRNKLHLYLIQGAITSNKNLMNKFKKEYLVWKDMIKEGLEKVFTNVSNDYQAMSMIIIAIIDGLVIQNLLGIDLGDINKLTDVVSKSL